MQTQQLTEQLKTLRLRGMASALEESLTALSQKKLAPTTWLAQLLQAEMADRQARSYEYQLRLARFPVPRDLDSFDFKESAVNETQLRQLYAGDYLITARNIVFVGGTGTGKSHLATALARHARQAGSLLQRRRSGESARCRKARGTRRTSGKPLAQPVRHRAGLMLITQ